MSALCFVRASCLRIGSAEEEIWSERGSLPWSCSASMFVILPFLTVTRTRALPYWVSTASPVAVPDAPEALPLADEPLGVAVAVAVAVRVVDAVDAVAVWVEAWGWKARTPAVPAMVAAMTMGDRCMGRLRCQEVKDSKWIWLPGTP